MATAFETKRFFCHICGGHRHHKGITAQLSDGSLMLFGRNCAEEFFGPNIWEKCWGEFKRAQDLAFARYRMLNMAKLCIPMVSWIASHRHLVLKAKEAWNQIEAHHEQFFAEVENELKRHNGRITETEDVVASKDLAAIGLTQSFSTTSIITSVRSHHFFPHVTNVDKDLIVIEAFLAAIQNMGDNLTDHQILEYSRRVERNVRPSTQRIDGVLALTADFMSEEKLPVICAWSDRKRVRALNHLPKITPRNLADAVRKSCGHGYEVLPFKLEDTIPNLRRSVEELAAERKVV